MPRTLDLELRRALAARIRYYNELGIYDFYRRPVSVQEGVLPVTVPVVQPESREEMSPRKAAVVAAPVEENIFEVTAPKPEQGVSDPAKALRIIREDLGDCTRCPLHKQGRKQIVFGVGNPTTDLMFVGEGPGADEDEQGEPFVGRAGQLLNNMIKAMGLQREQVYIANIVKCRPPGNRTPEREECETCSPFLMRQIAVVKPKVIVALGATAVEGLLGKTAGITRLRGNWRTYRGIPLMPTYHPAYLLRNQSIGEKRRVWEDMLKVMEKLGLPISQKQRNHFLKPA